ncbi:hypothetical protein [Ferrovum sp.]|uniref:hypothetical protein n=1 Tax=Ferrovum sp. TaxID=2609467 RepID=UPI0026235B1D|nr:hypothetical protein [Ferrovum sp.]
MADLLVMKEKNGFSVGDDVVCDNKAGTIEDMTGLEFGNDLDDLAVRVSLKNGGGVVLRGFYGDVKEIEKGKVFYFQDASWYGENKAEQAS